MSIGVLGSAAQFVPGLEHDMEQNIMLLYK